MFTMQAAKHSPTVSCSISLPAALRDAARQAAYDDNRSLSGLVSGLLRTHLEREGYLGARTPDAPKGGAS